MMIITFTHLLEYYTRLRNKIFQYVVDINRLLLKSCPYLVNRCDWYDLGCFPHLLLKFKYTDRFKLIYNALIRDHVCFNNNNNIKIFQKTTIAAANRSPSKKKDRQTIKIFKKLYVDSAMFAARYGDVEALDFLHQTLRHEIDYMLLLKNNCVVRHLPVIEYMYKIGSHLFAELFKPLMTNAAEYGNLDVVKFLHFNVSETCTKFAMDYAAMNGHLEVVKFLYENRQEHFSDNIIEMTSHYGHLEVIQYLLQNTTAQCNSIDNAILAGKIDVVKYLYENTTGRTSYHVISNCKNIDVFKYIYSKRTEFSWLIDAANNAAWSSCFEIVKFLNENQTLPNAGRTVEWAALGGHFEILEYLITNNEFATCSSKAFECFSKFKDCISLQWFRDNTTFQFTSKIYKDAIFSNNLSMIKWIRQNTTLCYPDNILDLKYENYAIIKYLSEQTVTQVNISNQSTTLSKKPKRTTIFQDYRLSKHMTYDTSHSSNIF